MGGPELRFVGHSTVRVELAGRSLLTDPLLTSRVGPLRRVVPAPEPAVRAGVDLVLLSHLHADHLHLPSLRLLGSDVRLVAPRGAGRWLRRHGFAHVAELSPGESLTDGRLKVTAVAARHSGHRWGPRLTSGPDSPALGHLVEGDSWSVFLSGDTGLHDGMHLLGERGVDVAVLPVWGWGLNLGPGHLDPVAAAEAVARLRPRYAVPVHWGTLAPRGTTRLPSPLRTRMRRLLTEPPRTFAAEVAARGLDTTVVVAQPGDTVTLSPGVQS
ncbi:MBL fold metallo-hydrolase [Blastococcus sp. TF02A-30]|uniref:MBL fold metallo-hydrolase n=1 Tax=Blastococcus sp. TF02A-30 TaxID=2250580 RepID=UPI000DEAA404|nr:MBL fold metallo-hydrolase [Blastococcus sp. TF02A-30]RBY84486.1 MBL fold metallo-hydrolase [Blastococcus sp. TF02A-30]